MSHSDEYNDLISSELAEIAGPLQDYMCAHGYLNSKGFAAMLLLMAGTMNDAPPTKQDHEVANLYLKGMSLPMLAALFAQVAKGLTIHSWRST